MSRPCELSPTGGCTFLDEFKTRSTHEQYRERCAETFARMMEVSPELQMVETDCPFAVAQAWQDTELASELRDVK